MDWAALFVSLQLAGWTAVILLPVSIFMGRLLAYRRFAGKGMIEALERGDKPLMLARLSEHINNLNLPE